MRSRAPYHFLPWKRGPAGFIITSVSSDKFHSMGSSMSACLSAEQTMATTSMVKAIPSIAAHRQPHYLVDVQKRASSESPSRPRHQTSDSTRLREAMWRSAAPPIDAISQPFVPLSTAPKDPNHQQMPDKPARRLWPGKLITLMQGRNNLGKGQHKQPSTIFLSFSLGFVAPSVASVQSSVMLSLLLPPPGLHRTRRPTFTASSASIYPHQYTRINTWVMANCPLS